MRDRIRELRAATRQWLHHVNLERRRRGWVSPVHITSPTARLFVFLVASLAGLAAGLVAALSYVGPASTGQQMTMRQFEDLAAAGQVEQAVFHDFDHRITGTYVLAPPAPAVVAPSSGTGSASSSPAATGVAGSPPPLPGSRPALPVTGRTREFWTTYPATDAVTALLVDRLYTGSPAQYSFDHQTNKQVVQFIAQYLLPLLILANLFALIFLVTRSGGSSLGGVVQFGRVGSKQATGGNGHVSFADVGGAEHVVAELREVRDYLSDPSRFASMGAQPPKGVLLFGPPGCGKTLMARAVAGEANVPFFSISGAEFVESLVGVGAARVRDLFRQVRSVAPAIVFIDEIDAAGRRRGGVTGGQEEREQTLNQLLVEMDGFESTAGIVVMGATNRPDILDPALLRPGRFDRQITVETPDLRGRHEILELHARQRPVSFDVDFETLARRTPGFTGADLANVINEAALLAVRFGRVEIGMPELDEAVLRVLAGPQRRGHLMSAEERRRAAYHESGHALVSAAVGRLDDLQRVSIVARGRSLGQSTASKRWQERVLLTRSELRSELVVAMGGVAAEELVLGEPSTGAQDDLARATELAQVMVGLYGMSERLGKVSMVRAEGSEFLGGGTVPTELASGPMLVELHQEVRRLLDEADGSAQDILSSHRSVLHELAERLLNEETLEGSDLELVLEAVRPEGNIVAEVADGAAVNGHHPDRVVVDSVAR